MYLSIPISIYPFQHTAARRRLLTVMFDYLYTQRFQHTAARRRLLRSISAKAAINTFQHTAARRRLHGQRKMTISDCGFQHTAARRRLLMFSNNIEQLITVSTHSRPKAAALRTNKLKPLLLMFQHTAARRRLPQ